MRRLLYLTVLSMLVMAMTASVAFAQPQRGPSGDDGSYNCEDFDTRAQAQSYFEANNPDEDPDGLDADSDGEACESLPEGAADPAPEPTEPEPAEPAEEPAETQYAGDDQYAADDQYADDDKVTELPDTGGPALLPLAGILFMTLVAGGFAVSRFRR